MQRHPRAGGTVRQEVPATHPTSHRSCIIQMPVESGAASGSGEMLVGNAQPSLPPGREWKAPERTWPQNPPPPSCLAKSHIESNHIPWGRSLDRSWCFLRTCSVGLRCDKYLSQVWSAHRSMTFSRPGARPPPWCLAPTRLGSID